jgi:hypothetical protein
LQVARTIHEKIKAIQLLFLSVLFQLSPYVINRHGGSSLPLKVARVNVLEHHRRMYLIKQQPQNLDDSMVAQRHKGNGLMDDTIVSLLYQGSFDNHL